METIKNISELDPGDVTVVERLLGFPLETSAKIAIVLRVIPAVNSISPPDESGIPEWCNVLEGMTDEDLAGFQHDLNTPVQLAHSED